MATQPNKQDGVGGSAGKARQLVRRKVMEPRAGEFTLLERFPQGYRNREDITTIPPYILVEGSQNVLTNSNQRVGIRRGYLLDGQRDTSRNPVTGWFDWNRNIGTMVYLRAGGDFSNGAGKLQFRYVATADGQSWNGNTFVKDQVYWIDLLTGFTQSQFNFTSIWDITTEQLNLLLFVNNTPRIWEWSGGVTTFKSASFSTGVIATYYSPGVINTVSISSGGSNYQLGDLLTLQNGGNGQAVVEVTGVGAFGIITAVSIRNSGVGYSTVNYSPTGGHGNAAVIGVSTVYTAAGTGYQVGDSITVATGGGNATFEVLGVTSAGAIKDLRMTNPGTGYSAGVKATTTAGGGTGAQIDVLTVAKGYIECEGTKTWAENGFYSLTSNRAININGTQYTYTGGEGTKFIVGINADASATPVGAVIFQQPIYTINDAMYGLPATKNNTLITSLNGYVFIAQEDSQSVFISKQNNYKDYRYTSPIRASGEGALLQTNGVPKAFVPQQSTVYISAGTDNWYQVAFNLSADLQNESVTAQQIKTTGLQGAQSQALTTKIKNYIAFISNEPILNSLGIDPNVFQEPRVTDISFPIVNDMLTYDFTGGSVAYSAGTPTQPGQFILVAIPKQSIVQLYNMTDPNNPYWEAPQILPIVGFSIIDGEIYGHSSQSTNTFKMFTGYNDDGHAIKAVASFAYNNGGIRPLRKSSNGLYIEGYINPNTNLAVTLTRDFNTVSSYNGVVAGNDTQIVPQPVDTASLGKTSFGKKGLGMNATIITSTALPPKFRVIKTYPRVEYFEEQVTFTTEGTDQEWQIISFGTNATPSFNEPTDIRQ